MSGEDRVVGFDDSRGHLGRGRDGKGELGLPAVVDREPFEQERSKTGTSSTTGGVKDEESLEASAGVGELADAVKDEVDNLLADGAGVSTGVIVSGILLSANDLLGVVELAVGSVANFVTDSGLEIDVDGAGNVPARASLAKEGVKGVVGLTDGLVRLHGPIGINAVLETVEFPALVWWTCSVPRTIAMGSAYSCSFPVVA